jgi:NitT/TauT family transport system substrate-binding protein
MLNRSWLLAVGFALLGFTTTATGCFADSIKMNIGYLTASDFLPAFVAKEQGFFQKHGIDATLTRIALASNMPAALLSKSIDIGASTGPNLLQAAEGGLDLVAIAGITRVVKDAPIISLLARQGLTIAGPEDLKGRKVGVPGFNSLIDVMFRKWLRDRKVAPADITLIEAPLPQMPDLLKSGTLDAVAAIEPIRSRIAATGAGAVAIEFFSEVNPDALAAFWAARRDWAGSNRAAVTSFRAAFAEGVAFIATNPDQAREIEKKYLGFNSPQFPTYVIDLRSEDFAFYLAVGQELGLLKTQIDVTSLIQP